MLNQEIGYQRKLLKGYISKKEVEGCNQWTVVVVSL